MKGYHEGKKLNKLFMGLISVVLCFALISSSTVTAFAATAVEQAMDLAEKLVFKGVDSVAEDELCLIVFEDMSQNGADSEGRAIIGGDLTIVGSWSASVKHPYADEYVLGVGGNIIDGGINAGGCVAIGGGSYSEAYINTGGYCCHGGSDAVHVDTSGWVETYISQAQQAFTAASAQYAALPADGTAFMGGWEAQWNIIANPDHVAGQPHVFYIDLTNSWSKNLSEIHFYGDFGNDAIIINVNGGTVNFTGGGGVMIRSAATVWNGTTYENVSAPDCTNTMDQLQSNIIWNCYEAEEIKISAYAIQGSFLAPYANVTGDNGHVNGTTVVRSMVGAGGFEYHTGHFFKNPFSAALTVSKVVQGTPASDAETEFSFTLTKANGTLVDSFTLAAGETYRFSDFEENVTYVVTELDSSDKYTFGGVSASGSYDSISGKRVTFTASDGSSRDIVYTNVAVEEKKSGSLTVEKLLNDSVDSSASFSFTLEYYQNGGWTNVSGGEFTLANGQSKTFSDLAYGQYRVTEVVNGTIYNTSVSSNNSGNLTVSSAQAIVQIADGYENNTLTYTNTRRNATLTVAKTLANGSENDGTAFGFELQKSVNGTYTTVESFTLTAGQTKQFTLPVGVDYKVVETNTGNNYQLSAVSGNEVYLVSDATATFTNAIKSTGLTVTKKVSGSATTESFGFVLEKSVNGSWSEVESFTLTADQTKTFTGLSVNGVYRVRETSIGSNYQLDSVTGADSVSDGAAIITMKADTVPAIVFTNKVKTGELKVTKTLSDSYDNADSSFGFTVYRSDDNGSTWTAIDNFTLAGGASKTISGLDVDKLYKVVENDCSNKYTTTVKVGSGSAKTATDTGSVTLTPDSTTSVSFINVRRTAPVTVKKSINGTAYSGSTFTFRLYKLSSSGSWVSAGVDDITVAAGSTGTFSGLAYGNTYAVAELGHDEYTFASVAGGTATTIDGLYAVSFDVNGAATVTFTNTPVPKLGGFTVTKAVSGHGVSGDKFTFTVEKKNGSRWSTYDTFTLAAGESKTYTDLTAGEVYRVYESSIPSNYSIYSIVGGDSVSNNRAIVTITDKSCPTILFTNKVKTGSLTVTKTLNDSFDNAEGSFSFSLYESTDNGSNWSLVESFTLSGGASKTYTDLDVTKKYKVVEADYSARYDTSYKVNNKTYDGTDTGALSVTAGSTTAAEFINTRKTASVSVTKAIDGTAYEGSTFTFRLYKYSNNSWVEAGADDITIAAGQTATFSGLAYGNNYAVAEVAADEYTFVSVSGAAYVSIDGHDSGRFTVAGDTALTFTNKPIPRLGGLTVTKLLSGAESDDEFTFIIQKQNGKNWVDVEEFTLLAGQTKTFNTFVEGETYRIRETSMGSDYELHSIENADSIDGDYAVVTIVEGGNPNVTFTNKLKDGSITVNKTLTDAALSGESTFNFELQKKESDGSYTLYKMFSISVAHGNTGSYTIDSLPYNTTYRIVEVGADSYETTVVADNVTVNGKTSSDIMVGGEESVTFTNTKKVTLTLSKAIAAGDSDLGSEFTFVIQRQNGSAWDTVDTVVLKATDVPVSYTLDTGVYRVLELTGVDGYLYDSYAVTGGISSDKSVTAVLDGVSCNGASFTLASNGSVVITNRTVKGSLFLTKIVTDKVTPDKEFKFTLQKLNKSGVYEDVLDANGVAVIVELAHGEMVDLGTVASLEYGSTYRVVETVNSDIYTTTVVTDGNVKTAAVSDGIVITDTAKTITFNNTRKTASIKVVKALTTGSNDLGESFEIEVYKFADNEWTVLTTAEDGVDGSFSIKAGETNAVYLNVPVGVTYKIVETKTGSSYTFSSFSDNVASNNTIALMNDVEVTVYNTIKTGKLSVTKSLTDSVDPEAKFTFIVTDESGKTVASNTIGAGETFTVENLPYGNTYTVTESVDSTIYSTKVTANGKTTEAVSASVTINGDNAAVSFANTRLTGVLTVSKLLSNGSNLIEGESFTFQVYRRTDSGYVAVGEVFELTIGESKQIELPVAAGYCVVETGTGASYEFDSSIAANYQSLVINGVTYTGIAFDLTTDGAKVDMYNKNGTASITVSKSVINGTAGEDDTFTLTLYQKVGSSYNKVSEVTLKAGETAAFPENASYPFYLANEYKIVETSMGDRYELSTILGAETVNGTSAFFTLNADKEITYVNSVKQGKLVITKAINDSFDADATVTVTAVNADTGEVLGTASLGNGGTLELTGLAYGTRVKVTESYNENVYSATVSGLDENNIITIASDSATVKFTNTRKTGSLTVVKALAGGGAELNKSFEFVLQELSSDGSKWTDVKTFTLKADGKETISGLNIGAEYRIIETDTSDSFEYSSASIGTLVTVDGNKGTRIVLNGDTTVTVTNTLKTAKLTIGKTIAVGGDWQEGETFTFVIEKFEGGQWVEYKTVTLTYDERTWTSDELTVSDKYRVTETNIGYRYELTGIDGATSVDLTNKSGIVTILPTGNTITFTNEVKTGTVVVTKTLNDALDTDKTFTFTATYTLNGATVEKTFELGAGDKWVSDALPYGTVVTVKENTDDNYTTTVDGAAGSSSTVTVKAASQTTAFTNVRKTGSLTVVKKLAEGANDLGETFAVTLYENGTKKATKNFKAGESVTFDGLSYGAEYKLVESTTGASYSFVSITGVEGSTNLTDENGIVFAFAGDDTATVTNDIKKASLTIKKSVEGNAYDDSFTFKVEKKQSDGSFKDIGQTVTLNAANAYTVTLDAQVGDVFRVTETNLGERYTLTAVSGADSASVSDRQALATIDNDGVILTFTNKVNTGKIIVKKTLDDTFDSEAAFTFTAVNQTSGKDYGVFTIKGGESFTIDGVEYGDKVVIRESVDSTIYTTTVDNAAGSETTVELKAATVTVNFSNVRNTGTLTVSKKVTAGENLGKVFTFALQVKQNDTWSTVKTFTVEANKSVDISGLFVGASYRVVETDTTDSFTFYSATGGQIVTVEEGTAVEFVAAAANKVEFTNKLNGSSLRITKTIAVGGEWVEGEKFTFKVEKKVGGEWVEVDTVTLTYDNRSAEIDDVYVGDEYRVTETNIGYRYQLDSIEGADSVDLTAQSAEVVISTSGDELIFVNEQLTGELVVKKVLNDAITPDKTFTFTVERYNAATEEFEFYTSFELGANGTKTLKDLPYGETYKVTESGNEIYNTTYTVGEDTTKGSAYSVMISNPSTAVTFTNTRATAKLTVDKVLLNGETDEKFSFKLEKKANGEWVEVDSFQLSAADEVKAFSDLEIQTEYRITETIADDSSFKFQGAEGVTDGVYNSGVYTFTLTGNSDVVFTNQLKAGGLTVRKVAANAAANDEFSFVLYKVSGSEAVAVERFTLLAGESKQFTGLLYGDSYIVKEEAISENFSLGSITGADSVKLEDAAGYITIDGAEDITFTNVIRTGSVIVTKTLEDNTDPDAIFTFKAYKNDSAIAFKTFTLTAGEHYELTGLNYGDTVKVVEDSNDNYETTIYVDGTTAAAAEVVVKQEATNVEFVNVRRQATLTITKKIADGDNLLADTFTLVLEQYKGGKWVEIEKFTLSTDETSDSASKSFELDINGDYKVTELDSGENYTFKSVNGATKVTGEDAGTLTLTGDTTVTVTNTVKTGTVSVTKELIDGYAPGSTFSFTASYNVGGNDITKSFSLGSDGVWVSDSLPYGTVVTITEATDENYSTTVDGKVTNTVELTVGTDKTSAAFKNIRKVADLNVVKALANGGEEYDQTFTFDLEMYKDGEWTIVSTFQLKAGEKYTATNLYHGVNYRVVETESTEYFTFSSASTGTAIENGTAFVVTGDINLTMTNKLESASLEIIKNVTTNGAWQKNEVFTFKVERLEADGTWTVVEEEVRLTYDDRAWTKTDAVVGDVYRVTETTPNYRYYLSSVQNADVTNLSENYAQVTIVPGGNSLTFNNTVYTGSLTVQKSLIDSLDTDATFPITVVNKTTGETWSFYLGGNGSYTIYDINFGDIIEVSESVDGGKYTTTIDGAAGTGKTITINQEVNTVVFENTRKTGDLTVTKKLTAGSNDLNEEFSVELFENGTSKGTKTFKAGQSVTFTGLSYGASYELIESATGASYQFVSITGIEGAANLTHANGIGFTFSGDASAVITNDVNKATLKLVKIVEGTVYDDSFTFKVEKKSGESFAPIKNITLNAANGYTATIEAQVGDVYRITEVDLGSRYILSAVTVDGTAVNDTAAVVTIGNSGNTVAFTNTVRTGDIVIKKALVDSLDSEAIFAFTAVNKTTGETWSFELGNTDTYTISGVEYGDVIEITETVNGTNYTTTVDGKSGTTKTITVNAASVETVFTNTRNTGSLTVTKALAEGANDLGEEFTVELYENGKTKGAKTFKAGETVTYTGLSYGATYRLIETKTGASYNFVSITGIEGASNIANADGVEFVFGGNASATVTNDIKKASFTVKKNVVGNAYDDSFTFKVDKKIGVAFVAYTTITLNAANGYTATIDAQVGDVYRITETGPDARYALTSVLVDGKVVSGDSALITIGNDGNTAEFTNTVNKGSLTIVKSLTDSVDSDKTFTFTAVNKTTGETWTFELGNTGSYTIEDVEYGDVIEITETVDGTRYTTTVDGTEAVSKTVTIASEAAEVRFSNVRKTGSLQVTKALTAGSNDLGETFIVDLYENGVKKESKRIEAGETVTFDNLSYGASYKLVESDTGNSYTFDSITGISGASALSDENGVSFTFSGNASAVVTNDIKTAALTLKKSVSGSAYDDVFTFTVEKKQADGSYAKVKTITLNAANGYTASMNAQVGDVYRVTETNLGTRYTLHAIDGADTVSLANKEAVVTVGTAGNTVTFTNKVNTGKVIITKSLEDAVDGNATFTFNVKNTTTGETWTFELGNKGSHTIDGIEYGDVLTITETVNGTNYTTTVDGKTASTKTLTVTSAVQTVAFSNVRNAATLTVTKELVGNKGSDLGTKFSFTLERLSGSEWVELEKFTLTANQTVSFSDLSVGEQYRVVETNTSAAFSFNSVSGDCSAASDGSAAAVFTLNKGGNDVVIVNKLNNATLTLSKEVTGITEGVDITDSFTFTVEKQSGSSWIKLEDVVLNAENNFQWSNDKAIVGDVYRFTEQSTGSKYSLTAIDGGEVELDKSRTVVTVGASGSSVRFTNALMTSKITVTKTLEDIIDPNAAFNFEIFRVDGDKLTKVGSTFTLKNGESKTTDQLGITVLRGESYVVKETSDASTYATTLVIDGSAKAADSAVTLTGDEHTVEFINERKTTDFEIRKTVSGVTEQDEYFEIHMTGVFADSEGKTETKVFVFNKTGKADEETKIAGATYAKLGDSVKVSGVLYGAEYKLEEIGETYYSCWINNIETDSTVITAGKVTIGDFSNVRKTADLTVTKTIGKAKDLGDTFTFQLYAKIDGEWVAQGDQFTLGANESKTISDLAVGLYYKVIELDSGDHYLFGKGDDNTTVISNDKEQGVSFFFAADRTVTISNIVKTDSITVRKQVLGEGGNANEKFAFTLEKLVGSEWVVIENFTLAANGYKTFDNLDLGETYRVIETDCGETHEFQGISIKNIGENDKIDTTKQSATVVLDGSEDITFTNTPTTQTLKVVKELADGSNDLGQTFSFSVYKSVNGAWVLEKNFGLKAGEDLDIVVTNGVQYKIIETDTGANYQLASIKGADSTNLSAAEAIVLADTDRTVTFVNEILVGSLVISKVTSGLTSNNTTFGFTVTDENGNVYNHSVLNGGSFSLAGGESITINEIPYGTTLYVTESVDTARYNTLYAFNGSNAYTQGVKTSAITIQAGKTSVTFVNQYIKTDEEIMNEVLGETGFSGMTAVRNTEIIITGYTGNTEDVGNVYESSYTIYTDVLGEEDISTPQTGDEIPFAVIVLMAVSGLMVLVLSKRRRQTA